MAKKELTLVVRARNAVAAGLRSVMGSVKSLGGGILKASKWIATGVAAATAAIGAVAAKALSSYAGQEKATRALASSLAAAGDDAATLVPKLQAVASAIQDETGADDDAVVAGMARLRLLGVTTDKLGEAARATIALKAVGLEETAAQKAVAMAMQGSYDMLNRYVPALRTAKDETEKARIVSELFAKGYQQQKAVLNTTSGAWAALKGRVGDVWEEIGKAIERSFGIRDALNKAGDAVKRFGERVSEWIDSEKFQALQTSIQGIINAMKSGDGRAEVGDILWDGLKASFMYGADLIKAAGEFVGLKIAAAIKRTVGGKAGRADAAIMEEEAGKRWDIGKDQARLNFTLERFKLEKRIAELKPPEFVGPPEPPSIPPAVVAEPDEDAQEAADARIAAEKEANDKLIDERERLLEEYAQAEKDALAKRFEAQRDAAEKELALAEELAGKKIAAFIQEGKDKEKDDKDAEKQAARDAKRAKILADRQRKGGRLSKQQQEWLDAFNAIDAAKGQLQPLRDQIKVAEDNLAQLRQTNRTLAEIQKGLAQNHAALNALIKLG